MINDYVYFPNVAQEAQPPVDGILSRTIYQDDQIKAILFGFAAGQELSEHTAARPAILWFVQGEAIVGLGTEQKDAVAGTWIHMRAGLTHSVAAKTPVVMLLVLLK
jgi:quercetin dioxygenase-like cupin family protein